MGYVEGKGMAKGGIEITPKSEKIMLAIGYVSTAASGALCYSYRNEPIKEKTTAWVDCGEGIVPVDPPTNLAAIAPWILFVPCALFLSYWKLRIWWRHY